MIFYYLFHEVQSAGMYQELIHGHRRDMRWTNQNRCQLCKLFVMSTGLMQLFNTVQGMQEQLKEVHETALQLAAEKEDRKRHINVCAPFYWFSQI